jgi:hypothetical protein
MTNKSRREFLKKLARGSLYAAPVVATLVTPQSLSARWGMGSGKGGGMGKGMQVRQLPDAPWFKPPPGQPPASTPPGVRDPGIPETDAEAPSSDAMLK